MNGFRNQTYQADWLSALFQEPKFNCVVEPVLDTWENGQEKDDTTMFISRLFQNTPTIPIKTKLKIKVKCKIKEF